MDRAHRDEGRAAAPVPLCRCGSTVSQYRARSRAPPHAAARRRARAVRESLNGKAHSNCTHRLQVDTTHRTRALPRLKQRIA